VGEGLVEGGEGVGAEGFDMGWKGKEAEKDICDEGEDLTGVALFTWIFKRQGKDFQAYLRAPGEYTDWRMKH